MKKMVMWISVFILLVLIPNGIAKQYSKYGNILLDVKSLRPIVVSSTGLTSNIDYYFNRLDKNEWILSYCHKDFKEYSKNFLMKDIPIKTISKDNELSNIKTDKIFDFTKSECGAFSIMGEKGDIIKVGNDSTIINITEDDVQFIISPEYKSCTYLKCSSNIVLENNGNNNVTINSSDISIQINSIKSWINFEYTYEYNATSYDYDENGTIIGNYTTLINKTRLADVTEDITIIIESNLSKTFYIHAIMPSPDTEFKYNVTFFYDGVDYMIDPYFITDNSTFNDGTYNRTFLNESGFVQLNLTYNNGTYTSKVIDVNSTVTWDNISWFQELCYQCELPDNKTTETGDYVTFTDMTQNVLLLHMNNDWNDSSGESNNAEAQENVNFITNSKFGSHAGNFSGVDNNMLNITDVDSLDIEESLTMETWIYFNAITTYDHIINKHQAYRLRLPGTNPDRIQCSFYRGGSYRDTVTSDAVIVTGEWHHVACTIDTSEPETIYIYVDGQRVGSKIGVTGSGNISTNAEQLAIGCKNTGVNCFTGFLDEVAIYNRELSQSEIIEHYKRGALELNLSVRSCNDDSCSGESFIDINNTSPQNLFVADNRYFQYRFNFETENESYTPQLYNVSIGYTSRFSVTLDDLYGLNSSLGRVDTFNSSNLEEIEYMELNFSIVSDETIDSWYLNFTTNGTSACSLGNKQSKICYYYNNDTYKWIQFINGTDTDTFDGTQGTTGDRIEVIETGNATHKNISLRIDEHYNPNVFKWYSALFNFSDQKFQDGLEQRINNSNQIKVRINTSIVPLNADQYKLDFRVNYSGNPTSPIMAYACNSSYVTGDPCGNTTCVLIAQKLPGELQDDGTKFRGLFTKNLMNGIGDIKYIVLHSHETNISNYYFIKTYRVRATNYTTHWEYSVDEGVTWNNLADGYETELNINWFYNGIEPTAFVYNLWVNTTNGSTTNLEGVKVWSIDPANNYPPIISISNPNIGEVISLPYNITFSSSDPNGDNLNTSLLLYKNGILNLTMATNMNQSNTSYYWNASIDDGNYDLILMACELNTTDLFCVNHSHVIAIDNTKPYITLNAPIDNFNTTSTSVTFNWTATDNFDLILDCNLTVDTIVESKSSPNGTLTAHTLFGFSDGTYNWSVTCMDDVGNTNISEIRTFTIIELITEQIFNCKYNPSPYLKSKIPFTKRDRIEWFCYINRSEVDCITEVYKNNILLQTNPERAYIKGVGEIDVFSISGYPQNYFRVWFNKENLLPEEEFNFTVKCSDESDIYRFSRMIIPTYKDLSVVAYRGKWLKDNMSYIIFLLIFVLFIILMVVIIKWQN